MYSSTMLRYTNKFIILILCAQIKTAYQHGTNHTDTCTADEIEELKRMKEKCEGSTFLSVSKIIENDETGAVEEFLKLNDDKQINVVVNQVYTKSEQYVDKILKFIGELPSLYQRGLGYTALFNEMESHHKLNTTEAVTLAFWIKETLDLFNFKGVLPWGAEESKFLFENLKEQLPPLIKSILWDEVCIRNTHFRERIYAAADDLAFDSLRRRVFSWIPETDAGHSTYFWKFEPVNESRHFKIMNTHFREYLQASNDREAYDEERRRVYTARPGNTAATTLWNVTIYNLEKNLITIQNDEGSEYLYSACITYDKERRQVFTWRVATNITDCKECKWEIISC